MKATTMLSKIVLYVTSLYYQAIKTQYCKENVLPISSRKCENGSKALQKQDYFEISICKTEFIESASNMKLRKYRLKLNAFMFHDIVLLCSNLLKTI